MRQPRIATSRIPRCQPASISTWYANPPSLLLSSQRLISQRNNKLLTLVQNTQEVQLAETRAERDLQESLAELFSIIISLDQLEKAFLKDAVPEADYAEICERSLKQYKSILADETVAKAFGSLEEFKAEWDVRLPLLLPRAILKRNEQGRERRKTTWKRKG